MMQGTWYQRVGKRGLDLIGALGGLLVLWPVLLIVSAAIRIRMGRPVFYKQTRPGAGERLFKLWKFRTMITTRDSNGKLLPDEQRLTRLGRLLRQTSLDEIPQLFNVLIGEMSLVGPRPLIARYLPRYTARQSLRHQVKPGMTGWAQIHGRNQLDWDARLEMDVWYVEHMGVLLDVKICLLTLVRMWCWRRVKPFAEGGNDEFWGTLGASGHRPDVFPPEEDEVFFRKTS